MVVRFGATNVSDCEGRGSLGQFCSIQYEFEGLHRGVHILGGSVGFTDEVDGFNDRGFREGFQ